MKITQLTKRILRVSLAASLSLGLWTCSQAPEDSPVETLPDIDVSAETGFIGIRLQDADGMTRADDGTHREYDDRNDHFEWFNKGTADERAIINNADNNRILLFNSANSNYSFFGSYKLTKPTISTASSNIYVAHTKLDKDDVAYAIVVLNADSERMDKLEASLKNPEPGKTAVETVLRYLFESDAENPESQGLAEGSDGKKYFTMSSTVYRAEESTDIAVLTPLHGQVFFETVEEAVRPENLTTFYVERILAKFTLLINGYDGNKQFSKYTNRIIVNGANRLKVRQEYAPAEDDVEKDVMTGWKINVVNWGLNGLEKNTYLMKNLLENPDTYPWTIETDFYTAWNSPALFRSYWGIDENYSKGTYPDQYRQALDVTGVTAATTNNIYSDGYKGLEKDDYTLIYKPYNAYEDLTENKYSLENTFAPSVITESKQDLNTKPWLRCGTHIIMTAQLIIDEIDKVDLTGDKPGFIKGVQDKYFSNGMYWSEKALKEQAVATLMTNIYFNKSGDSNRIPNVLDAGKFVDFINTDEHQLDDDAPISASIDGGGSTVVLEHKDLAENAEKYFEFAPAFIKGGDGWVTLKKKDDVTLYARYVNRADNTVTEKELKDEQIVSYIYRFTNLAKHYKEGRMYYALPIRHNLESVSFRTDPVTDVRTGDYGVVRNTWYRMTINSIQVPGTPVDDPDQPIIPNPEPDDKSLGVEVEVIPWNTVEIDVDQIY